MNSDDQVSVICVYNNKYVFDTVLKESLSKQIQSAELIGVDNINNRFHSAASALNYGASLATGSVFVFVHQDVSFEEPEALGKLIKVFTENSGKGDVGGVVGAAFEGDRVKIIAGSNVNFLGEKAGSKGFASDFEYSESVDELLLLMTAETFNMHPFDEKTCNGWHFYAVEQCLNARCNGNSVLTINAPIKHISPGHIDSKFYWAQYRLAKKYSSVVRIIGTCCDFKPRPLYRLLKSAVKSSLSWK